MKRAGTRRAGQLEQQDRLAKERDQARRDAEQEWSRWRSNKCGFQGGYTAGAVAE